MAVASGAAAMAKIEPEKQLRVATHNLAAENPTRAAVSPDIVNTSPTESEAAASKSDFSRRVAYVRKQLKHLLNEPKSSFAARLVFLFLTTLILLATAAIIFDTVDLPWVAGSTECEGRRCKPVPREGWATLDIVLNIIFTVELLTRCFCQYSSVKVLPHHLSGAGSFTNKPHQRRSTECTCVRLSSAIGC